MYRVQKLTRSDVLEQIADGAGSQRLEDPVAVVEHGEHDEIHLRQGGFERAHAVDAGKTGQIDVGQHHVGRVAGDFRDRLFRRGILRDAAKAGGAVENRRPPFANRGIVLKDGDSDAHRIDQTIRRWWRVATRESTAGVT